MRKVRVALCVFFLLLFTTIPFLSTNTYADDGGLFELAFSGDKKIMTIGDELTLSIDVLHGADYQLLDLASSLPVEPFQIKKVRRIEETTRNQAKSGGFRIVLTHFELGQYKIASIPIRFVDSDGAQHTVYTDEWDIAVMSVRSHFPNQQGLRGIKQVRVLGGVVEVKNLLWVVACLIALLGIFLLMKWSMKAYRDWLESKKTPFDRAMESLERLGKEAHDMESKAFYSEISFILKNFLCLQHQMGSLDLTTKEFLVELEQFNLKGDIVDRIKQILKSSDRVKFAKHHPRSQESRDLLKETRSVIEDIMKSIHATPSTSKDASR